MTTYTFNTKPLAVRDTGPAKLPGLSAPPPTGNPALDAWVKQATEHIEVRAGSRGNPYERAVTVREFAAMAKDVEKIKPAAEALAALTGGNPSSSEASRAIDAFTKAIKELPLYKDLIKRLDDPSRFDKLPGEIRALLLRSLAEEAAKRGAEITRVEKVLSDARRSLSFEIKTVTAAVQQAQAGVREVAFATAEANFAQAGKITQLEASLGNYYQDGTPGRALLEEQMTVTADKIAGLSSQWTMKVQAGKYVAGIGLAATENPDGSGTSALIVAADKFAIVNPATYTTGLTNTPDPAHIPFGVDANGIYMNSNVYVKGSMRVDTGGRTLIQGLRGSVDVNGGTGTWSDTTARNTVWTYLGNSGSPPNNNHLVIGDTVAIGTVVRQWNGSAWASPGVVINGDMLVNGSVSAAKINTNNLDIRDGFGNVIFSAGTGLSISRVTGAGDLATQDDVRIGDQVKFPDGTTMNASDFVNRLSRINSGNISVFMDGAAIGNAYIGNAQVDTLKLGKWAVVIPRFVTAANRDMAAGSSHQFHNINMDLGPAPPAQGSFGGGAASPGAGTMVTFSFFMESHEDAWGEATIYHGANEGTKKTIRFGLRVSSGTPDMCMPVTLTAVFENLYGSNSFQTRVTGIPNSAGGNHPFKVINPTISIFGGKR